MFALVGSFAVGAAEPLFDDFTGPSVDANKWYGAKKNWDKWHTYYSGGVVPANLHVTDGTLKCEAHGDLYTGSVQGYDESNTARKTRVGACIVSKDYYASGRYEIRAKVAPVSGVCCAMWTSALYDKLVGEKNESQEDAVQFQLPGRPAEENVGISYAYALCNTAAGKKDYKYAVANGYVQLAASQDDGQFHTYRFDWHTGGTDHGTNITARVDYYVDDVLVKTTTSHIPTMAGRLWVGAWFPKDWAGTPDFDTSAFEIDYVRVTPFNEANDVEANESNPTDGLVDPAWTDSTPGGGTAGGDSGSSGGGNSQEVCMEPFFDDFSSGLVDSNKWFAAKKNWGGETKKDSGEDYNGGVVPENVYVVGDKLQCEAHGNLYEGDLIGVNKPRRIPRTDGKRVGGCVVTKNYYASGRYEVRAKIAPKLGVCSAIWTFEYEEIYAQDKIPAGAVWSSEKGYYAVNHEIDIEMPGRPLPAHENIGFDYALCNTWIGEEDDEYLASHTKLPQAQNDGQFHDYRFDWHTGGLDPVGGTNITPRVDFYFDGVKVMTNYDFVPSKAGRLWIGTWFPNGWAGVPDFESSIMEVDWVRITPFGEPNDLPPNESYASADLVAPLNVLPPTRWEVGSPDASSVTAYLTRKGKLVFSGEGAVKSFATPEDEPWADQYERITAMYCPSNVTVDAHALNLPNLKTLNGKPFTHYYEPRTEAFYDDFSSGIVDSNRWFAANKNWGGKIEKYSDEDYNGGVVPANLFVKDGKLQCVAHGSLYEGDVEGICKVGSNKVAMPRGHGKRVGACAVTKDYFASGSYEMRAKVAPSAGVCCTMWTFEYEELYDKDDPDFKGSGDYCVVNHEIDIEMPGRPGSKHENISYEYALCNTWVGEKGDEYTTGYTKLAQRQDDGNFHTYRFDWHTGGLDPVGGTNITPRVDFYFDGVLTRTNTSHIPTKAGRLWVGAWFPNGWAGVPDFDTDVFEIDYVKITPFNEPNDRPAHETYPNDGLSAPYNLDTRTVWDVGTPDASSVQMHINANNELVFTGRGAVKSYATLADAPWAEFADRITGAKVAEGVTFAKASQTGLAEMLCINGIPTQIYNGEVSEQDWGVLYDDFSSGFADPDKWYAAHKNWGGEIDLEGEGGQNYNGGVVKENLYVKNSVLQCEAHGSLYEGDVLGITKGGEPRRDGKRAGACIVSKDYFASGRYEMRAKVAPAKGVCCTMWTFEYEEHYPGEDDYSGSGAYSVINHEIDIEMPGRPQDDGKYENVGYDYALCNTWIGEKGDEYTASHMKLPKRQDDGEFHHYRFDWHAGNKSGTVKPRVEFYFDGVLVKINYNFIPFKAGRFWVGAWFPRGWAGTPNFDTSVFEVDWIKITPYFEENDAPQNETYGNVEELGETLAGLTRPLNIVPPPFWEVGTPNASDVIARMNTNGVLTLTGLGAVTNFASAADAPWASMANEIKEVVINDSWDSAGPFYLYSKDWVQHWGYEHLDGDMTLSPGSLAGLTQLEKLNGTSLQTYSEVLRATTPAEPATLRVDPGIAIDQEAQTADLPLTVFESHDNVNWTPVDATFEIGEKGNTVNVEVVK